jgi:hypothetical protein
MFAVEQVLANYQVITSGMHTMQMQTARPHNGYMPASDCTGARLRAGSFNIPAECFWLHSAEGTGRQVSTLDVQVKELGESIVRKCCTAVRMCTH